MASYLLEQLKNSPTLFMLFAVMVMYMHKTFASKESLKKDLEYIREKLTEIKEEVYLLRSATK